MANYVNFIFCIRYNDFDCQNFSKVGISAVQNLSVGLLVFEFLAVGILTVGILVVKILAVEVLAVLEFRLSGF